MAQGKSGRVVIQIDPILKVKLYVELAKHQITMKDWFVEKANQLIKEGGQNLLWEENKLNSQHQRK